MNEKEYEEFYKLYLTAYTKAQKIWEGEIHNEKDSDFRKFVAVVHKNLANESGVLIPPDYYPEC